MSSSGRAGHGRGNNRKRPFKRREGDAESWQKGDFAGLNGSRQVSGNWPETGGTALQEGKAPGRGQSFDNQNRNQGYKKGGDRGEKAPYFERPKWIPPKMNSEPLPVSNCPWCGKPIRDISSAISDKDTGSPVHFDCVLSRVSFGERLENGEIVMYIGGGRFGVVCFGNLAINTKDLQNRAEVFEEPQRTDGQRLSRDFTIKKIIEWEDKEKRAEWRSVICDHYSVT